MTKSFSWPSYRRWAGRTSRVIWTTPLLQAEPVLPNSRGGTAGIKEHNIAEVARHGAKCMALVTELVGAGNIGGMVKELQRKIQLQEANVHEFT